MFDDLPTLAAIAAVAADKKATAQPPPQVVRVLESAATYLLKARARTSRPNLRNRCIRKTKPVRLTMISVNCECN
jgi:hypothetical protein